MCGFLWPYSVPRPALPDDGVALVAHGGAGAGGDVLRPLHQGVQVLGVGLGGGPLRTLGGRLRDLAKRRRRAGEAFWKTWEGGGGGEGM